MHAGVYEIPMLYKIIFGPSLLGTEVMDLRQPERKNQYLSSISVELSAAGLEGAQRLLVANSQAALQNMMNQQNAALRGAAPLGGAPLILSPRLQVPTSLASGLMNGSAINTSAAAGPPPLIAASDTSGLLYAQYAAAASAADYANYSGLVNPLLAADYSTADPSGGLFAR